MPEVAIMSNFLAAFAELPKTQQKKVREFTEKFRRDPRHPSINYENLHMRDSKVRSARIDNTYRAIIVHPPSQDVFLLVWVDHHDQAYQWARNRVFEVNPASGALQVYQCEEVDAPGPAPTVTGLFQAFSDSELDSVGVPRALLPAVRSVASEAELDKLVVHLPRQAADGLQLLGAGYTLEQVLEQLTRPVLEPNEPVPPPPAVDTEDFLAALKRPETQEQFCVVSSDEQLADILNAPLEQWRIFLHPTQRRLATQKFNGPARVLGGAGTGKTVVLLHRATHLARNVFQAPTDRLLVTTYTRNLASDLQAHLRKLCPDACDRIEVANLHRWAFNYLAAQGTRPQVLFDADQQRKLWSSVCAAETQGLSQLFYQKEWEMVVQANDVLTRDDYLAAPRVGRGTRLSRPQKVEVWKIFEEYRARLNEMGKVEFADVVREARLHLAQNGQPPYRAVLADEVQDFRMADLRLLRAMVAPGENDLFVVGDAHQRIYGHKSALGKASIQIRGRSRHLRINYRTTQEIRRWAIALLEGQSIDDLDGGTDDLKGYRSLRSGMAPDVRLFESFAAEITFLKERLGQLIAHGLRPEEICVSTPLGKSVEEYHKELGKAGFAGVIIDTNAEPDSGPGIRFATMHRMKGLEFRAVVLAGVQDGSIPGPVKDFADVASKEDYLLGQRCLLYVAATRARDVLVVTGSGRRCPLFG